MRSQYVYVLFIDWCEPSLLGAFTVKHELKAYVGSETWRELWDSLFVRVVKNNSYVGRPQGIEEFFGA